MMVFVGVAEMFCQSVSGVFPGVSIKNKPKSLGSDFGL